MRYSPENVAFCILQAHLLSVMKSHEDIGKDFVVAVFEAYHASKDERALLDSLELFVQDAIGKQLFHIGTRIVHSPASVCNGSTENLSGLDSKRASTQLMDAATGTACEDAVNCPSSVTAYRRTSITADGSHVRVTGSMAHLVSDSDCLSPAPGPLLPVTLVYYAREMADVALELSTGVWKNMINLHEIDWKHFADGFPNLFIHHIKDCRFHAVLFLASFHDMTSIMEQLPIIYALPSYSKRFSVVVPYFPTGRRDEYQAAHTLKFAFTCTMQLRWSASLSSGRWQQLKH
jgi:hypothetical protein